MTADNTVAITGLGLICSLGRSPEGIVPKLLRGASGVRKSTFTGDGRVYTAARVTSSVKLPAANWPVGRGTAMALSAARLAAPQAGAVPPQPDPGLGLIHVSGYGNLQSLLKYRGDLKRFGLNRASPMQFPNTILHAAASFLSLSTGAAAFNITLSGERNCGLEMLETARQLLVAGAAERVLCVASEELSPELISLLEAREELDSELPDPFGEKRSGYAPGEAAVAVMLEPTERATRAGHALYCTLLGHGYGSHPVDGVVRCRDAMQGALAEAHAEGREVGCILANANGSRADWEEAEAVSNLFEQPVPVTSIKSALGECGAAGSLLGIAAMVLCAAKKLVPPTQGRSKYDPKLPPLDLLRRKQGLAKPLFLINSLAPDAAVSQVWQLHSQRGTA